MNDKHKIKKPQFEALVTKTLMWVENHQFRYVGVRTSGGSDPRDYALVARYVGPVFRFDVCWSEFYLCPTILIKYERYDFSFKEGYVYFEPFIEYLTGGREKAIFPYFKKNMTGKASEAIMEKRKSLFDQGLTHMMILISKKFEVYLDVLVEVSKDQILGCYRWQKDEGII